MEQKEKNFEIKGTFLEKQKEKKFAKTIEALNENNARLKLFALFGSKHRVKRRHIFIKEIKEIN